jgi:hypothetical protein
MGLEILEDGFGDPLEDDYYGVFKVGSDPEAFEILSGFIGVRLEFFSSGTLR